jgi:signal transduction histidine kinase
VLDNLIGNALKFSLDGSQVDIWVDIYPDEPQYLWLRVQDKGIGIPKSDLERIFERFYQGQIASSRRYGGIGVGLAIVKHIIHAHQGRIWVQSEIGQGKLLPCVAADSATGTQLNACHKASRQPKILSGATQLPFK